MTDTTGQEPAFPTGGEYSRAGEAEHREPSFGGLTKREWLAGMALVATGGSDSFASSGLIADRAVRIADAVLERLAR
jgi:hypothetical protein